MTEMTRRDRQDLQAVARTRARVAKAKVATREAQLVAQAEEQLSAIYSAQDEAWADITAKAEALVKEADDKIAAICREKGISEDFRPRITPYWHGRGMNADPSRRAELRTLVRAKIAAAGKEAKTVIDARSADVQEELIAGGLESEEARRYLDKIPSPDELMPPIPLAELEVLAQPKTTAQHIREIRGY
jgi:hypothetical protein